MYSYAQTACPSCARMRAASNQPMQGHTFGPTPSRHLRRRNVQSVGRTRVQQINTRKSHPPACMLHLDRWTQLMQTSCIAIARSNQLLGLSGMCEALCATLCVRTQHSRRHCARSSGESLITPAQADEPSPSASLGWSGRRVRSL